MVNTNTHTHTYMIRIYSECVRQDGDNVRHMHLIDLHLLKCSLIPAKYEKHEYEHEQRHQQQWANNKEKIVFVYIPLAWTIENANDSHRKREKERMKCTPFAVIRCDTVTVQWIFVEPPHTRRIYQ